MKLCHPLALANLVESSLKRGVDTNETDIRKFLITLHHHSFSRQSKPHSTTSRGLSGDGWSIYLM
jgi:hypothetical protein